jgi:hypothetical protein
MDGVCAIKPVVAPQQLQYEEFWHGFDTVDWGGSSIAASLIRFFAADNVNALGSLAAKSASE